jgi:hypothetical protein
MGQGTERFGSSTVDLLRRFDSECDVFVSEKNLRVSQSMISAS